jgi:Ca2+/Na+ antiporter
VLSVLLSFSFDHRVVCPSVFFFKKTEEQTTRWLKEKDRRTDNTMVKRKRQKNRQQDGCLFFCLFLLTIVLSVLLSFSFDHRVVCPSVLFLLTIVLSVLLSFSFYHRVVCSSETEEQTTRWLKEKDRRTDNTMVKRKRQKNRQHDG